MKCQHSFSLKKWKKQNKKKNREILSAAAVIGTLRVDICRYTGWSDFLVFMNMSALLALPMIIYTMFILSILKPWILTILAAFKHCTSPFYCQSQQLSSALSSACNFKSHFCKHCGLRSDCSFSSLIWVHIVCLCAKIGLKSLQEYSADVINRRHFQMQVFLAF